MRLRRTSTWRARPAFLLVCLLVLVLPAIAEGRQTDKLDKKLDARAAAPLGTSRVILQLEPGTDVSDVIRGLGGRPGRRLGIISGMAAEIPNGQLRKLAEHPAVRSMHHDRPIAGQLSRVATTVGARSVQQDLGFYGAGVGVAVIDSGITPWHDDLTYNGSASNVRTQNGQRVSGFVDFVNGRSTPYDDNGHGTHVAGIVAGNGYDTYGWRAGIAPAAHLVSLKVLDSGGRGVISNVIAALDWTVANRYQHNIRVVNLSVGAAVTESYNTDPLALAAKRAVEAGIVVVAASGNLGRNSSGETLYGGIAAPGNAPWVLTVGAYSTQGTSFRFDDVMAPYSSRGPSAVDFAAKPDLVAPGTGIVSLSDPASTFYSTKASSLVSGYRWTSYQPYLTLSGTSMAAPVVAGTVALMLEANPSLTPNLVKAVLQYTAQNYNYDALTQGAGFLNSRGAVQLARFFATAQPTDTYPQNWMWSKRIIWGNYEVTGGVLAPNGNAWALNIVWGTVAESDNIVWGTACSDTCDNIVWGTIAELDNIVWGTGTEAENIVWGTARNIVWGTAESDNIVWGTARNIVWGTACGGTNCDNIVWGTAVDLFNIVWGTAVESDNIVWGTATELDNIVWGTIWGTAELDNIVWGTSGLDEESFSDGGDEALTTEDLFPPAPPGGTSTNQGGSLEGAL